MTVVASLEDAEGLRCIDIILRPDGIYGFKEYRRDAEDCGRWFLVADYSDPGHGSKDEALRTAAVVVGWLDPRENIALQPHV